MRAAGLAPEVRVSSVDEVAVVVRYGVTDPAARVALLARVLARADGHGEALWQPQQRQR